jgi:hypothetical protein
MTAFFEIGGGVALALVGWLAPRWVAATRSAAWPAVLVDALPAVLAATLLFVATGRPIFSGLVVLALGAGLALADRTKRDALREPLVFSDISELPHVFTHPQLYLPFAGPALVIGGTVAAVAVGVLLLYLEPSLWTPDRELTLASCALAGAVAWVGAREPMLGAAAAALRRLKPSGEPVADAARLGPFAMLFAYGIIARAERAERRARYAPPPAPALRPRTGAAVPVILVQCESFFDARRLSPAVAADLLPGFDRCRNDSGWFGRLDVSGWGANTMRAEFAALTGIPEAELGYDRFNPYHALARAPIASLVRELRKEGYRTLCLHPFDRGFFRRGKVMPLLGFDAFLCRKSLGGSRRPPYFPDPDLACSILDAVRDAGPRVFVFAITMGNHGPWRPEGAAVEPGLLRQLDPTRVPQGGELLRYLAGLRRSDEMLEILVEGLERRGRDGIIAFYGDHLPSLPRAFDHFGFAEQASDYLMWPGTGRPARRLDLPVHRLPGLIRDALRLRRAIAAPVVGAVVDGAA